MSFPVTNSDLLVWGLLILGILMLSGIPFTNAWTQWRARGAGSLGQEEARRTKGNPQDWSWRQYGWFIAIFCIFIACFGLYLGMVDGSGYPFSLLGYEIDFAASAGFWFVVVCLGVASGICGEREERMERARLAEGRQEGKVKGFLLMMMRFDQHLAGPRLCYMNRWQWLLFGFSIVIIGFAIVIIGGLGSWFIR